MNSTQLDIETERKILLAQHVSGFVAFLFNIVVLTLIFIDVDIRNKGFRKYICVMVICSLALDTFSDIYAPIVFFNQGLLYSDSMLSDFISAAVFYAIFLTILAEFFAAYFACVYYRWSVVMPEERMFNFHGWKRIALYLSVQLYIAAIIAFTLYFYRQAMVASEHSLPPQLEWVKSRTTFAFTLEDRNIDYANYVGNPAALVLIIIIFFMIRQIISEVKRGMNKASSATKRYQLMAIRSLILQGVVPSMIYVIPSVIGTCFELDLCDRNAKFASILSPILWIILTKHTFANSLTILYCTPSYRAKLVALLPLKIRNCICSRSALDRAYFPRTTTVRT